MTTGEVLRVRAAMKPIATVPRALRTVDVATGEATTAHHQRSDVCAVPAAGIVAEAMVALVLADAVLEKFGGDSVGETRRNAESYLDTLRFRVTSGLVLVGPMGAGKSTVAALLADAWGVTARDTDADIEALEGRSISDIFVESGEAHFRDLERKAVAEALATHDGVLALGGGAVLDPATRELLAGHTVVFLRVGLSDAVKRVGLGSARPLLLGQRARPDQGAARRAHADLRGGRHPRGRHRRAHARRGRQRDPSRRSHDRPIRVAGPAPYDVVVGHGVQDAAARDAGRRRTPGRAGARARGSTVGPAAATRCSTCRCPRARPRRPPTVVADCWERLGEAGFTRSDAVVTVGRRRDHRPRRLRRRDLAARRPRRARADLAAGDGRRRGRRQDRHRHRARARTWSAPSTSRPGVLCDLDLLATLPAGELVSGLARWSSAASSPTPRSSTWSRRTPRPPATRGSDVLAELVERAVRVKAEVVAADLRETGGVDGHPGREVLNYGHTLAHADREGQRLRRPARRGGLARHGLRRRAGAAGRSARRRDRRPARRRAGLRRAADGLVRGDVRRAAGGDAGRQEDPR